MSKAARLALRLHMSCFGIIHAETSIEKCLPLRVQAFRSLSVLGIESVRQYRLLEALYRSKSSLHVHTHICLNSNASL